MNRRDQAKLFEKAIRAELTRWLFESDLNEGELARAAFAAIDGWLDDDVIDFEDINCDEDES
ncbi:hypothetical protein OAK38_06185 [Verrucomicrobia bacterium]|nr:hypothetical protein [Verrucomicrobiota bacterium]